MVVLCNHLLYGSIWQYNPIKCYKKHFPDSFFFPPNSMNFHGIFVLVLQVPWGSSRLLGRLERCQRIRKEKDQNGEESSQHHIGPGKGRVTEADTRKLKWEISKTIAFNAEMFLLWDVLGAPQFLDETIF